MEMRGKIGTIFLLLMLHLAIGKSNLSPSTTKASQGDEEIDVLYPKLTQDLEALSNDSSESEIRNITLEEQAKLELSQYPKMDPLPLGISMTVIYGIIMILGLSGNIITITVIRLNSYMHTPTNYFLTSLAISDMLLLVSGLPMEIYHIWVKYPYIFGEAFCVIRGLAAECAANSTVLTITAFTVERFVAICYPLKSHLLSQLSKTIRIIAFNWVLAFCAAVPQAARFGLLDMTFTRDKMEFVLVKGAWCTLVREIFPYSFQISIIIFFVFPATIITVLYVLIGLKLRRSSRKGPLNNATTTVEPVSSSRHSQGHVIRMLVCVVVCFFLTWGSFQSQRLMALYGTAVGRENLSKVFLTIYKGLTHVSGILYYLSTCINPILYHTMSHKFRQAFKDTVRQLCGHGSDPNLPHRNYSAMSQRSGRLGYLNQYKSGSNNSLGAISGSGSFSRNRSPQPNSVLTNASASATNFRRPDYLETIEESDKRCDFEPNDLNSSSNSNGKIITKQKGKNGSENTLSPVSESLLEKSKSSASMKENQRY